MPYCPKCGSTVKEGDSYCSCCAEPLSTGTKPATENIKSGNDDKYLCIFCYLGILFFIPLLIRNESQYVRYHVNQGLVLFIFSVIVKAVYMIPFIGWLTGAAGGIFVLVLLITGIVNTCNGICKPLPLIGNFTIIK